MLFIIVEVNESYSLARKQMMDAFNPKVQEWKKLMWQFQQASLGAKDGKKWSKFLSWNDLSIN